ncbi:MAG: triple tyrosine motif-containing protein [Prevotella sp.]|nr:triple tyrosine motif-containing protein [Prevotella sp.]
MNNKTLIITLYFLLTAIISVTAQLPVLRNFSPADYNSGTQNWCVSQTDDGRMLFANNTGLLCFDGYRWTQMSIPNHTNIRAVLYDNKRGVIYAGATNEFGYYSHDAATNSLRFHSLAGELADDERNFGEIWAIYDMNGDIVFQGKSNFFIHRKDGRTVNLRQNVRIESSAVIGGRLIFASKEGIHEITGDRTVNLPGTEPIRGRTVRAIMQDGQQMLLATAGDGVFTYDGRTTLPYPMDITPILREGQIFCATISTDYMAFGTVSSGLILKNRHTGAVTYANIYTGLQNNTVLSVAFDRQNNVWLGLDNGISYVIADAPYRDLLGSRNSVGTGYASAVYRGRLYIGTNQGLFSLPMPLSNEPHPHRPQPVAGMAGQVWNLRVIGNRLLCAADGGAYIVDGERCSRIGEQEGTWNFCPLKRHPGYIMTADYKGFCVLHDDGKSLRLHSRLDAIADIQSGSLMEGEDGTIWICHWQKGVYRVRLNATLTDATVVERYGKDHGLLMDENNVLCRMADGLRISAVDGFYRYDAAPRKLVYDKPTSTIFNNYGTPLKVFQTPDGKIMAMKAHFAAVAKRGRDGRYVVDSISLRGITDRLQLGLGDVSQLDSAHTIVNHDNGFYIIGSKPKAPTDDNRLIIRRIMSTAETDSVIYLAAPAADDTDVKLPHSLNSIKIEFALPEYTGMNNVEYRCMLEGYDKEWSRPMSAPYKEYTQLPSGTYKFRVRALNRISGRTQEIEAVIKVLPAWYETWLAYIIYIVAAGLACRYVLKIIKRRTERELVRIKAEQERQMREQEIKLQVEREKRKHQLAEMRNEQLDTELKHKQSQLSDSTMNLMRKNDMLQQIDGEMAELSESMRRGEPKARLTRQIQDIRKSIQTNMNDDDNWEKFEENFNMVYDDFMKTLTARFPDLKTNDRKLCAYLRMGLSSKEMASLLNTPVRSIETARYRLRKKLNLDGGENLTEFIRNI